MSSAHPFTPEIAREFATRSISNAFPNIEPGVGFLSIAQTAKFLGQSESHLRNLISEDRCPFPTMLFGARRLVLAAALIDLVSNALQNGGVVLEPKPVDPPAPPAEASAAAAVEPESEMAEKRGRGRPAKLESTKRRRRLARAKAAAKA